MGCLRSVLTNGIYAAAMRRHMVRNDLVHMLADFGLEAEPDSRITQFIGELLKGWKGHARKARLAMAAKTHADLIGILETTFKVSRAEAP